ncbi:bifunctional DNA primase/polymerase [Bradyrhizobium macuxiense]|uniref:bifunctional DNA primase/polymerase n=1 Tax=Bradyrhizobium macuxiense TaxID=1755647 RepID=UPI000834F524|nr:bifunctional DNA primase/polymerase [Bradyrhizobium macuxiense]
MLEPINHLRRGLIAHGYRPVAVKGKTPAGYRWQELQLAANVVPVYSRQYADYPSTGLICGELVGLDVDTPDQATAEAIRGMVPGASAAPFRIGKAPKRLYAFRTTEPRGKTSTGAYLISGVKCQVEVLGVGNMFVAFGTHPDTGKPYEWHNGSPAETPLADLPEITPGTVDALLECAEAHFAAHGTIIKRARVRDNQPRSAAGDHPWSAVNSQALSNLNAWVMDIGLEDMRPYASGYHSVANFRPTRSTYAKQRNRALSVQPQGIFDHSAGVGMSPIDLASACLGLSPVEAVGWLENKLGIAAPHMDFSKLLAKHRRPTPGNDRHCR